MGMSTKCPKNVEKKVRKNVLGGSKNTIFGHFWTQFLPIWSMLLFGDPVQCTPVTSLSCSQISNLLETYWKRLKGKNPEGKNFRKLLRRKQSSAKISKISRNTIKSSVKVRSEKSSEISSANIFFSSAKFSEVFALCVFYPLDLSKEVQCESFFPIYGWNSGR